MCTLLENRNSVKVICIALCVSTDDVSMHIEWILDGIEHGILFESILAFWVKSQNYVYSSWPGINI